MPEKNVTVSKPIRKKAELKKIKKLSLQSLVEYLKKVGEIVVLDILYTNSNTMPSIGKNSGKQFVTIQGDNREVHLGFNLFSRAVLESQLEDSIYYKDDDAEATFQLAWSDKIGNIYETEEKRYLKKIASVENESQ